jgi:hypothetical protein
VDNPVHKVKAALVVKVDSQARKVADNPVPAAAAAQVAAAQAAAVLEAVAPVAVAVQADKAVPVDSLVLKEDKAAVHRAAVSPALAAAAVPADNPVRRVVPVVVNQAPAEAVAQAVAALAGAVPEVEALEAVAPVAEAAQVGQAAREALVAVSKFF